MSHLTSDFTSGAVPYFYLRTFYVFFSATYERARHVCGLPPRPNKFIEEGTQPMPSIRLSDDITQYGRENDDQRLARNHLDREQFIERARIEASCETEMARQYYVEMMKMRRYRALMLQARRSVGRERSP